jgi:alkylresorcinol/alkylpyrone synthase
VTTARILGVGTATPPHVVTQHQAQCVARELFGRHRSDIDRLLPVFDHSGVERRHFCVPIEWFATPHGIEERNRIYVEQAAALSLESARRALDAAGVTAADLAAVFFVSSTGFATPSLDARLVQDLGCAPTTRRDATFGHGCAGGVGGLARAARHAITASGSPVLLVATELCSLTFQGEDWSKANFVSTSLFADGSAAVVVGTDGSGPEVVADGCVLWPGTEDVMGWQFTDRGMDVVLSRSVPALVREHLAASVADVLASIDATADDIAHHVMHPGGAKVLDTIEEILPLGADGVRWSRSVLREYGNMSAPTALFVLQALLDDGDPRRRQLGLVSAMGPGFAAEHVVLRW